MASKSIFLDKLKEKKEAEKKTTVKIETASMREKVKISNVVDKRDGEKRLDREEILKKIGKSQKKPSVLVVEPEKITIPPKKDDIKIVEKKSEAGPSGLVKEKIKSDDSDTKEEPKLSEELLEKSKKKSTGIQILPPSSIKLSSGMQILPKVSKSKSEGKEKESVAKKSETKVLKPTTKIEQLSDDEYAQFLQKLPPRRDEVSTVASPFYLNNRQIFVKEIHKMLTGYEKDIEKVRKDCNTKNSEFELLTHQKIVRDYINIFTPYRGLLVFHGLGSGKTCTSIAIAEGIKENKEIVVMLPASLETNYKEELKKCGDILYKKNQYWEFVSIMDKEKAKLIKPISEILRIPEEIIKKNKGAWFVDTSKPSNYSSLKTDEVVSLERQINAMIDVKYKFIRYNGITYNNWRQLTNNNSINPFDNKVVIIDEAHNLISRIVNKMQVKKDTLPMMIFRALSSAENCRIIMLTGTPIINYPNEIGIMLSILRGCIKTYQFSLKKASGEALTKASLTKILTENDKSNHMLDYIQIKITESKNFLTITRNPYGFWSKNDEKSKRYMGVELNPQGNETEKEFLESMKQIFVENKITIEDPIEIEGFTALPLEADEFNGKFIKNMDIGKPEVQNMNLFKRRILGLVSYFPDIEALLPKFEKDNPDYFKIINIPMSQYQFDLYDKARVEERKDELRSAMSRVKRQNGDELYNIPVSTYRVFSRAFCNFVFPPGELKRPMPNDGDATEIQAKGLNEDLLDGFTEEEKILEEDVDGSSEIDDLEEQEDYEEKKSKNKIYQEKISHILATFEKEKDTLFTPNQLEICSPKFLKILQNLQSEDNIGLNLIYSQFRMLEGIGIFSLVLKANGFAEFKIKKDGKLWNIQTPKEDYKKPKFVLYTGQETVEEKELIRKIFNGEWDSLPIELKRQVLDMTSQKGSDEKQGKIYNPDDKNKFGEAIKIIMITASGAEGISLRNVRYVHIMEPYWHPVRLDQVIGRARRICSHSDFKDEKYRTVEVFLYLMVLSKEQEETATIEMKNKDVSKLIPGKIYTSDQALYEISLIKEEVNKDLLHNLKEAAIDCILHKKNAKGKPVKCFGFGGTDDPEKLAYVPNIDSEEKDSVTGLNEKRKTKLAKPVKIKGVEYMIGLDDVKLENVAEDGSLEAKLYSKASFESGHPVQVGCIIYKVTEKDGVKDLKPTKEYYLGDCRGKKLD